MRDSAERNLTVADAGGASISLRLVESPLGAGKARGKPPNPQRTPADGPP